MLDIFITSRVRRKIVVVFAKYPDFKTHVRALSKLIKEDPGNIQRELQRLERGGFLLVTQKGNTKIYHSMGDALIAFNLNDLPRKDGQNVKLKLNWKSFNGPKSAEFELYLRPQEQRSYVTNIRKN